MLRFFLALFFSFKITFGCVCVLYLCLCVCVCVPTSPLKTPALI